MKKYKASNQFETSGIGPALAVSVGLGLVAGLAAHFIGQYFRLLILFELGMGAAAGFGAATMVTRFKIRAPWLAAAIGLVGGLAAIVGDEGPAFWQQRSDLMETVQAFADEAQLPATDEGVEAATDVAIAMAGEVNDAQIAATIQGAPLTLESGEVIAPLAAPEPWEVLVGWVQTRADAGMTIGRVGQDGEDVGATGTLVWMLIGFLCVLGFAVYFAGLEATQPFDEEAGEWFPTTLTMSGMGHAAGKKAVRQAFDSSDIPGAVQAVVAEGKPKKGYLLIGVGAVNANGAWLVRLIHHVNDKTQKTLGNYVATRREVDMLLGGVAQKLEPAVTGDAAAPEASA